MRKSHNAFLIAVVLTSLCATVFAADAEKAAGGVVNINTAEAAQLALLPRVGASAAERIVQYRTEHGPFAKPTDLMQVKGFGEKTFERLRAYIVVEGKTTLTAKVKSPRPKKSAPQPTNTASK
jgi:competence ComEA-like helix-hairpin-helix protein